MSFLAALPTVDKAVAATLDLLQRWLGRILNYRGEGHLNVHRAGDTTIAFSGSHCGLGR